MQHVMLLINNTCTCADAMQLCDFIFVGGIVITSCTV